VLPSIGPAAALLHPGPVARDVVAEHVVRVGPSYLYPNYTATPGLVNPDITQANINRIRPPVTYTDRLKQQQLAHATDKNPAHYEEWRARRGCDGLTFSGRRPRVPGRRPGLRRPQRGRKRRGTTTSAG
jgi:hypothetical protein